MPASFVPLTLPFDTQTSAASSNQVSAETLTVAKGAFQPLAAGQKGPPVPVASAPAPTPSNGAKPPGPVLEVESEAGQVTRIRLRCGCGQVHELECIY